MDERPPYLLSDEDETLDCDLDTDPFADDVETTELDFDNQYDDSNYRGEDFWDTLVPEEEEEDVGQLDDADWYLKRESDIDNERW